MPTDGTANFRGSVRVQHFYLLRLSFLGLWTLLSVVPVVTLMAKETGEPIDDITGRYEFLGPRDTLAILEDAGKLKGYIDVVQGAEESDEVLSYGITLGRRKNDQVEIKTATIHRKYYRFKGTVERGKGRGEDDPDYLRLVGEVDLVTIQGDSGEECTQKTQVVLKSLGENPEEEE